MYATHYTMVIHSRAKQSLTMSKDKKAETWTQPCHKPYKFDLVVKVQGRIRIVNILDAFFHGDRPMCQIWYANVTANRSYRLDMETWQKQINLTLRSKVNIELGTWMYLCAKYVKTLSNKIIVMGWTRFCTDRHTDRQSDSYISPWTSFAGGIITVHALKMCPVRNFEFNWWV